MTTRNENLKQWILKQRLENYGYDWKDFNKMSGSKVRLKSKIKNMSDAEIRKNLAQAGILGGSGRLQKSPAYKRITKKSGKTKLIKAGKKQWNYTIGQSFNEELINIMHIGSGKQNNWWADQNMVKLK